jgi:ribonuclease VapC
VIVDSSAIIAILKQEPEAAVFVAAIVEAGGCRISAANFLEAAIVIDGQKSSPATREFDEFIHDGDISIEPVTVEQAMIAREAYRQFGRGFHRARLNFGDCLAYALAKTTGEPLLYKGNDFKHTDVRPAIVRRKPH